LDGRETMLLAVSATPVTRTVLGSGLFEGVASNVGPSLP